MAELPTLTFEAAMMVANATADGANERAEAQYEGSFNIEAKQVGSENLNATEKRGGVKREGTWITGWTLGLGEGPHVLTGKAAGVYADWYWFFGEFGTTHEPARPFMIPAFESAYANELPQAAAAFKRGVEGVVIL
jgi:HK97 gp10 family phage protein